MRMLMSMALVAALSVAVGCSGSSSVSSTPSRSSAYPPSTSQLIERADAICERLIVEFAAVRARSQSLPELARIVPHRVVLERRVAEELGELTPPAAIARGLQKVVAYRRTLAQELAELGLDAKRRDVAAIRVLAASKGRLHRELLATATSAGFKSCGRTQ